MDDLTVTLIRIWVLTELVGGAYLAWNIRSTLALGLRNSRIRLLMIAGEASLAVLTISVLSDWQNADGRTWFGPLFLALILHCLSRTSSKLWAGLLTAHVFVSMLVSHTHATPSMQLVAFQAVMVALLAFGWVAFSEHGSNAKGVYPRLNCGEQFWDRTAKLLLSNRLLLATFLGVAAVLFLLYLSVAISLRRDWISVNAVPNSHNVMQQVPSQSSVNLPDTPITASQLIRQFPPTFTSRDDQNDLKFEVEGRTVFTSENFYSLPNHSIITCSHNEHTCHQVLDSVTVMPSDIGAVLVHSSLIESIAIKLEGAVYKINARSFDYRITKWDTGNDVKATAPSNLIEYQVEAVSTSGCGEIILRVNLVEHVVSLRTVRNPEQVESCGKTTESYLVDRNFSMGPPHYPLRFLTLVPPFQTNTAENNVATSTDSSEYVDTPLTRQLRTEAAQDLQESVKRAREEMNK